MESNGPESQQKTRVVVPAASNAPRPKGSRWLINPVLAEIIGGISSLAAAAVTARRLIEERAYKNVSSLHYMEDLKRTRAEFGPELARQIEAGAITEQEGYKRLQEGVKFFESKIEERLAKGGVRNFWREFGLLRNHQKWEVAISSLSAGGITLGAVLLLSRGLFSPEEEAALANSAKPQESQEKPR